MPLHLRLALRVLRIPPGCRARVDRPRRGRRRAGRSRSDGVAAMIREWDRNTPSWEGGMFYEWTSETWTPRHALLDHGYGVWAGRVCGELASFLASSNDAAAAATLIDRLEHGSEMHRW